MSDFITFMAAPALGCLVMSFIFTYFGIHVLKRGIVFIDLSMAQLAALGTTVAFALNLEEHSFETILVSIGFVFIGATFFTLVRFMAPRISQEAVIGIVYVVAASLAVIVADRSPRAAEHIQHTLNGSILWISWGGVLQLLTAFIILGSFLWATPKAVFQMHGSGELAGALYPKSGALGFRFLSDAGAGYCGVHPNSGYFPHFYSADHPRRLCDPIV